MNETNFSNLLAAIREYPFEAIDMKHYAHPCGTPSCILGIYASRTDLQSAFSLKGNSVISVSTGCIQTANGSEIRKHFGISIREAPRLFSADDCEEATTPQEAAEYVEYFIRGKKLLQSDPHALSLLREISEPDLRPSVGKYSIPPKEHLTASMGLMSELKSLLWIDEFNLGYRLSVRGLDFLIMGEYL